MSGMMCDIISYVLYMLWHIIEKHKLHVVLWYDMEWYGMIWNSLAWRSRAWYGWPVHIIYDII